MWTSSLKQDCSANSRQHLAIRPPLEKKTLPSSLNSYWEGSREKSRIDLERLIQLYDGSTWVYTRGDKTARQVIDNPGVSLSGYSQPDRFFLICTLKESRDGGVDRMIVYQPLPHRLAARETREFITKLNDSPVKDLR